MQDTTFQQIIIITYALNKINIFKRKNIIHEIFNFIKIPINKKIFSLKKNVIYFGLNRN